MLKVENFSVSFSYNSSQLSKKQVSAITSLDIEVKAGEIMAVVGQSGAGKSLLAHAILGILPRNAHTAGKIYFKGRSLTAQRIKKIRGKEIALIPQSINYLNPLLKVGTQVARAARLSGLKNRDEAKQAAHSALARYLLDDSVAKYYPFQLSGGMARRILTATATVGMADLLLADEPTNGLDALAAEEALGHLRELADTGKAVLLITHDIESVLKITDRVSVFYDGITLEVANTSDFTGKLCLRHPYTTALWAALPTNSFTSPPSQATTPSNGKTGGCPYHLHCAKHGPDCADELPRMQELRDGLVRCHNA
ncbi:MAG: ABC transporter ATP-binding protein [Proteobacteria bacterium]|nr:ABC transporter ATP-binding protein [Pseudomonadota bacterium]MBU1234415.1 ABC transporter ATP-binding protein [Pseudomonadota bacterium]MBU1418637.1 ABC transporter ATP-binding protein [Pseudomonadota bacterium]MBU1455830.1 ABC transporter ATP-binding protein [Pseudomonadota bacterium]